MVLKKEPNEMAKRVRELRTLKNISMAELAKRIEITKGAMSQFERGYIGFTADNMGKIARVLESSTDYLILGDEDLKGRGLAIQLLEKVLNNEKFKKMVEIIEDPDLKELIDKANLFLQERP